MINCQICKREFETDKAFHIHLKKHGMYQAEYYCTYYPRKSLFYRRQIPFKNKRDYFSRQFIDLNEFLTWEKVGAEDLVKSKALELLGERAREKKYSYAPFHNEIKTLELPPISIFKKYFGSYKRACDLLGLSPVFDQPMPKCFNDMELPQFEILVDTREQDPLPFKKTKIEKLYVGDYLFGDGTYTSTFVDRKSEGDFLGTMASGFDRFEREVQKAVGLDGYLYIVTESSIDEIYSNHKKFRRKTNLEYVFHNMRELTHRYPRRVQFLFSGNREKSIDLIPKLLYYGPKLWNVDIQYYLDHELGNG